MPCTSLGIREIMNHLLFVDFYHGDDGRLVAMESLRDSVLTWSVEGDAEIQVFLSRFERYANQLIEDERESVEKERAFEKMKYEDQTGEIEEDED